MANRSVCVCVAMLSVIQSHNIVFVQYVFVMQFNGLPWQKISIGISSTYSTLSWISIGPFHWCAQMRLIAHNSLKRIVWVSLVCKTLSKPNRCKFPAVFLNSYLFYRLIKRFKSYHLSVDRFRSVTNTPTIEIARRTKVENVELRRTGNRKMSASANTANKGIVWMPIENSAINLIMTCFVDVVPTILHASCVCNLPHV